MREGSDFLSEELDVSVGGIEYKQQQRLNVLSDLVEFLFNSRTLSDEIQVCQYCLVFKKMVRV